MSAISGCQFVVVCLFFSLFIFPSVGLFVDIPFYLSICNRQAGFQSSMQ